MCLAKTVYLDFTYKLCSTKYIEAKAAIENFGVKTGAKLAGAPEILQKLFSSILEKNNCVP